MLFLFDHDISIFIGWRHVLLHVRLEFQKLPEYQLYDDHKDEHISSIFNVTNNEELHAH